MKVTLQTPGLIENMPHDFTAEASSLGIRPGQWPQVIETTLGNRNVFRYMFFHKENSDLSYCVYRQDLGCITLTIFND